MKNNDGNMKTTNLTDLFKAMEISAQEQKAKSQKKTQNTEDLPTIAEALSRLMNKETLLSFKMGEIVFNNPLSPIKSLEVTVSSTEARDALILHKLHSLTRRAV